MLNRMIVDSEWRGKCLAENVTRMEKVVSLRGQVSEDLANQLPFLKGLVFILEQLRIGCTEVKTISYGHKLSVIEQACR